MRSGDRSSGGVSEQGRRIDQTHKREAADGPCVASMTSLNLPERMNELSEGVIRPFNATREGRRGSISDYIFSVAHYGPFVMEHARGDRPGRRGLPGRSDGTDRAGGPLRVTRATGAREN